MLMRRRELVFTGLAIALSWSLVPMTPFEVSVYVVVAACLLPILFAALADRRDARAREAEAQREYDAMLQMMRRA